MIANTDATRGWSRKGDALIKLCRLGERRALHELQVERYSFENRVFWQAIVLRSVLRTDSFYSYYEIGAWLGLDGQREAQRAATQLLTDLDHARIDLKASPPTHWRRPGALTPACTSRARYATGATAEVTCRTCRYMLGLEPWPNARGAVDTRHTLGYRWSSP